MKPWPLNYFLTNLQTTYFYSKILIIFVVPLESIFTWPKFHKISFSTNNDDFLLKGHGGRSDFNWNDSKQPRTLVAPLHLAVCWAQHYWKFLSYQVSPHWNKQHLDVMQTFGTVQLLKTPCQAFVFAGKHGNSKSWTRFNFCLFDFIQKFLVLFISRHLILLRDASACFDAQLFETVLRNGFKAKWAGWLYFRFMGTYYWVSAFWV